MNLRSKLRQAVTAAARWLTSVLPGRWLVTLCAGIPLALVLAYTEGGQHMERTLFLRSYFRTAARLGFGPRLDKSVRFGTLVITVRACVKRPPEEPPQTAAFLQIDEVRPGETTVTSKRVFSGWMFASSPAISALDDPIYDITVLDCKTDATAAPSSGSKGK